jgi:hypothetical protein
MIAVYMFIVHTSANLDKISRFAENKASIISDSFYGQQQFTILANNAPLM